MHTSIFDSAGMLMQQSRGGGAGGVLGTIIYLIIVVLAIAGVWKVFTQAGKPGWASIIPIYNSYVLFQVIGRPGWWVILLFIPLVNIVIGVIALWELAKVFGKGVGFFIGLLLLSPIFLMILGFGDAQYQGPLAH